ncbi:HIT family protein [Tengunoibacter tsumagoiensis]|uniref:HIT domain-containing protein n=1 Tax=Tengunoibacter tsumagoiensis TaxID=2014871 RepID=A0A402A0U9_9CHLR|nr:HIT domain-containing protein [Tengunoibacter tsumagoiensis]GCE12682.1 hypothetical protein KTT_25410 [Tengunoibacter tsumagoiensis]
MQGGNISASHPHLHHDPVYDCTFCQHSTISHNILKETENFYLLADYAPLVEGHLLIVPKNHYACYGALPATYDQELQACKDEVARFQTHFYTAPTYWEHGVFHQTVFHAHLHCFPFGDVQYHSSSQRHQKILSSQDELRNWYGAKGHYFFLQIAHQKLLFAPDEDDYRYVIQSIFHPGIANRIPNAIRRTSLQRQAEGQPLIDSLFANWRLFQRQEEKV